MKTIAILGFGCAGYHCAKTLRELGYEGAIHVFSDTDLPPYNPMLTTYYAGHRLPWKGLFPSPFTSADRSHWRCSNSSGHTGENSLSCRWKRPYFRRPADLDRRPGIPAAAARAAGEKCVRHAYTRRCRSPAPAFGSGQCEAGCGCRCIHGRYQGS